MATSTPDRLRVLVACEHALIADTVRAALANDGHVVEVIGWPAPDEPAARPSPRATSLPEVGLMLCDLGERSTVHTAISVVEGIPVPWVALTGSGRGAAWGALHEAGVEVVLGEDVRLEQVAELLVGVVQHRVGTPADERAELVSAWRQLNAHPCA